MSYFYITFLNLSIFAKRGGGLTTIHPGTFHFDFANLQDDPRAAVAAGKKPLEAMHHEHPLLENVNQAEVEGEEARDVDEAISVLS